MHVDVENPDPSRFTHEDGWTAQPWSAAEDADIWVMHRGIPSKLIRMLPKKKSVALLHGTSEIMVLHEVESKGKNDKFNMHVDFLNTFKKVVAITKYDHAIMQQYDNGQGKLVYINDAVDTERFGLDGYAWPYRYCPAIISTTNIRINKNPAPLIWAFPEIRKAIPSARLNLFCINLTEIETWKRIILKSNAIGTSVENIHGQFNELRPFMRGADISFNSNYNGIFSRDSMEAMACGCSIVSYTDEHTPYACYRHTPSIVEAIKRAWDDLCEDPEGQVMKNRAYAEQHFSMEKAVREQFIPLYESM